MSTRAVTTKDPRPELTGGDRVIVEQPGLRSWEGTVLSVKPGAEAWMVDVRNEDMGVWILAARFVRKVEP